MNRESRASGAGPLGIVTRNSSPTVFVDHETGEIHPAEINSDGFYRLITTPEQARAKRWARKSVVNRILPESRVSKCMNWRRPVPGYGLAEIDVCKGTHGKAFYQGLMACGDIWGCACCAGKISERRRLELQAAIASATALGWSTHFVTLTVPHGIGDDLDLLLEALSGSLKRLSTGKYSIKRQLSERFPGSVLHGYIRASEVTHGLDNGWHPHFHILVFTSPDLAPRDLWSVYSPAWQRACRLSGLPEPSDLHGCTVQDGTKAAVYASKWGLEDEMTKAHTKQSRGKGATPFGLQSHWPPPCSSSSPSLSKVVASSFGVWGCGLNWILPLSFRIRSLLTFPMTNARCSWPLWMMMTGGLFVVPDRRPISSLLLNLTPLCFGKLSSPCAMQCRSLSHSPNLLCPHPNRWGFSSMTPLLTSLPLILT